jgi:hypothetical protein
MFKLRSGHVCAFILVITAPPSLFAQVPYQAVTSTKVKVRSGPDENHYTTAILEQDTRVTVVREEGNGWVAVEPPEGSFSWIAGEFVRELSATEGEVTGNDVLVRIGTPADPRKRDAWQKKLKRGDRVKILEKTTSGEGPLTKVSYKIAPPAGEVRYISAQYLQPVSGRKPTQRPSPGTSNTRAAGSPRDLSTDDDEVRPGRAVPSDRSTPADDADDDDSVLPGVPTSSSQPILERANRAFQEMMRRPLPDRNIAAVRAIYERAAHSATSDGEHRLIAERLDLLQVQEERQSKFAEFDRALRRSKQRDEAILSIPRSKSENEAVDAPESTPNSSPRYDGSGTLRRSTAVIDGKPAYVLLSPQGGIRYYVTPSPGIDLNKYLDKVVAVRGPSNYRVDVRAQHITVRDVTVIELNPLSYRDAKPERGVRRS